jgi:hypothetical protein
MQLSRPQSRSCKRVQRAIRQTLDLTLRVEASQGEHYLSALSGTDSSVIYLDAGSLQCVKEPKRSQVDAYTHVL